MYEFYIIQPYHVVIWWNSHLVGNIHLDTIVRQFSGYSVIVGRGNMCEDLELFIHIVHIFSVIVVTPWSYPNVNQPASSCLIILTLVFIFEYSLAGSDITSHWYLWDYDTAFFRPNCGDTWISLMALSYINHTLSLNKAMTPGMYAFGNLFRGSLTILL